jgi:hypothetical protein
LSNTIRKIVPEAQVLADVWQGRVEADLVAKTLPEVVAEARKQADTLVMPDNLVERVAEYLHENPTAAWDDAVAAIAKH